MLLQLLWLLAPTVALCTQQHASILANLPAVHTKLLIGSDNVHRWSEQHIWDAVLANVQVIVSTHAVLADALAHGFVKMSQLALLIYDEGELGASSGP
jgi:RecG-like helicase